MSSYEVGVLISSNRDDDSDFAKYGSLERSDDEIYKMLNVTGVGCVTIRRFVRTRLITFLTWSVGAGQRRESLFSGQFRQFVVCRPGHCALGAGSCGKGTSSKQRCCE